jgi:pilus assembly protein TadC
VGPDRAGVLLTLAAAVALWPPRSASVRERVRRLGASCGGQPAPVAAAGRAVGGGRWSPVVARRLLASGSGVAVALLLGGVVGVVAGAVVAGAGEWWLRRSAAGVSPDDAGLVADLPVACDLLAVCLQAGLGPTAALAAVSAAVPEPLRTPLRRVAGLLRLGTEPAAAWADAPEPLAGLARILVRAGESGSSVVPALRGLAAEVRADGRAHAEAAVRRAGVWVLVPLGACFLPAFLCLGVVPLVLGIARGVFG